MDRWGEWANYCSNRSSLILCWQRIRKFEENKQTDREHTDNSKPEATLIPVDRRSERANNYHHPKVIKRHLQLVYIQEMKINYKF